MPRSSQHSTKLTWSRWALAAVAALALADGSIVTLALPQLLHELHTSVEGVAAILVVYCVAFAAALPLARRLGARLGRDTIGIAGLGLFGAASLGCAAASSLPVLLVARAGQAIGAAAAIVLAFAVLRERPTRPGRRHHDLWLAASIWGTAAGPALGGALTQAFSWRAIFLVQAPVVIAAALLYRTAGAPTLAAEEDVAAPIGAASYRQTAVIALGAAAAALSAVLFLLVLLLVTAGGLSPLHAALVLSVLPAAALAAPQMRGSAAVRAALGCLAISAALVMLAFLPGPALGWLIVPELLAGLGMGLALPALAGELLPERTTAQASRLLTIRFAGIALTLIVLAPLIAGQLQNATDRGRLQGVAALVESPLSPEAKLSLAPSLAGSLQSDNPRQALASTIAHASSGLSAQDRHALVNLESEGDAIIFAVAGDGLRDAFLIAAALALIAALLVRPPGRRETTAALAACSLLIPGAYVASAIASRPALPAVGGACQPAGVPNASGITGFLQSAAISLVDHVACAEHLSREQLLLQIAGGG